MAWFRLTPTLLFGLSSTDYATRVIHQSGLMADAAIHGIIKKRKAIAACRGNIALSRGKTVAKRNLSRFGI